MPADAENIKKMSRAARLIRELDEQRMVVRKYSEVAEGNRKEALRHRRSRFARPSFDRYDGDHARRPCRTCQKTSCGFMLEQTLP